MLRDAVDRLREEKPVIHCITNYVTANDCANILLACGASPIMAEDADEVEEVTTISKGLNINIGTLKQDRIPTMFRAGRQANKLGHPVVFDPVGAGISELRTKTASELLKEIQFSVIKGNMSEMKALLSGKGSERGVDADTSLTGRNELFELVDFAQKLAKEYNTVIVITGETDIIANENKVCLVRNGNAMLGRITGGGCMLSTLITAFAATNPEDVFGAAVTAVCLMGVCGEIAFERMDEKDGNASFRNYLIDAVYGMNDEKLDELARYEML